VGVVVCREKSSFGRYAVMGVEYDKGAGEKMEEKVGGGWHERRKDGDWGGVDEIFSESVPLALPLHAKGRR